MDRVLVLLLVLTATGAFAAWWRARDGRVVRMGAQTGTSPAEAPDERLAGMPLEAVDVAHAVAPPTPLALVEFTAPDCQPCAAARRLLDQAAAGRPDITVIAIDVADALDLARAHRIMRAPTTLLITAEGHLLGRVAGVPRPDELAALLDSTEPVAAGAPAV